MLNSINRIKTQHIEKDFAEKIMSVIVNDLRVINLETKHYLKKVKKEFNTKKIPFIQLSIDISQRLNKVIR
jgi:hypothetical protein